MRILQPLCLLRRACASMTGMVVLLMLLSTLTYHSPRWLRMAMGLSVGEEQLREAIVDGNLALMRSLLDAGTPVSSINERGTTALHDAVVSGNIQAVRLLLAAGADPTGVGNDGMNPLLLATASGKLELVEILLSAGANPNQLGRSQMTPLHIACLQGSREIVDLLVQAGADVNATDITGATPLMASASDTKNARAIARRLLRAGARQNVMHARPDQRARQPSA